MRRIFVLVALALAGCAGEPAVSDISQDKVVVMANGAKDQAIYAEAQRGCGMFGKQATFMSWRCVGEYCIQKAVLYACIAPAAPGSAAASSRGGDANSTSLRGAAAMDEWRMKRSACHGTTKTEAELDRCSGPPPAI